MYSSHLLKTYIYLTSFFFLFQGIGEAGLFLGSSVFFALRDAVTSVRNERGLKKTFALNSPLTAEQIRASCADDFTEMVIRRWGKGLFKYIWVELHTAFSTLEWWAA